MSVRPTALIADDEPLLREDLARRLGVAWPDLQIVAQPRNGREAIERFDSLRPDVCFLDVQMPGVSGVDVARHVGRRAHVVFVTAFDRYAVEAFAAGALDYLVKPVEDLRLAETVARVRERLHAARPTQDFETALEQLAARLTPPASGAPLRWIRAQERDGLHMIAVPSVDYLRADTKLTRVAWRDERGGARESLVRMPLKELLAQLDAAEFAQVHRSVAVRLAAIDRVVRHDNETAVIHLKGRRETLPASRSYVHLFRQM